MTKNLLATVFGFVVLSSGNISAETTKDRSKDTAELRQLATEAGHAYARRDLAALESLTADDYIQTDVHGGVLDRAQWLAFVRNRKTQLTVESDAIEVRFYGETAVVTGRWTYTLKGTGADRVSYSRWMSVWTRETNGWKHHVFQNTYINANADGQVTTSGR